MHVCGCVENARNKRKQKTKVNCAHMHIKHGIVLHPPPPPLLEQLREPIAPSKEQKMYRRFRRIVLCIVSVSRIDHNVRGAVIHPSLY